MANKKAGVKKTKANKMEFVKEQQAKRDREELEIRHHTRIWMLDLVTVALGRMGFREARFKKFDEVLATVTNEYIDEFLDDIKDDPEMLHSRYCLERELQQYCGKLYRPEEVRYG